MKRAFMSITLLVLSLSMVMMLLMGVDGCLTEHIWKNCDALSERRNLIQRFVDIFRRARRVKTAEIVGCILNAFQSYTHPISVVYLNRLSRILNNATFMRCV